MKYIGENAIKKLISLIKGDLATKQDSIAATGVLERDTTGVINGVETVGATLVETQEAKLVDVPNGLLKGDGTTISAAVAGTDYMNSNQAIRYDAAQTLTDEQKAQARANIAAAPNGFGLGIADWNVAPEADADKIPGTGWFVADKNVPKGGNWFIRQEFDGPSNNDALQTAWPQNLGSYHRGCLAQRYQISGTWSAWEWVNPPMMLGVEYRTTERYLGKPVYVKLVDFGSLPNNTSKGVVIASNMDSVISIEVIVYSPESLKGAYFTGASGITNVSAVPSNSNVWINTDQDLSATAVYCFCKYTKTTN